MKLVKAPNGAVTRNEVLKTSSKNLYLEPTTEKIADGVWCIGGYSLANTTVEEANVAGKIKVGGDKQQMLTIFDMFDKFKPSKIFMVPPLED